MKNKKLIALVLTGLMLIPSVALAKGNDKEKEHGRDSFQIVQMKNDKSVQISEKDNSKQDDNDQENEDKDHGQKDNGEGKDKSDQKKADIQAFKAQLKAKHEIMKANTKRNIALKKEISSKSAQLQGLLLDIVTGKKTLSQNLIDDLVKNISDVKSAGSDLSGLKEMDSEVSKTQDDVKHRDFNSAISSMDKVIAKQDARYADMQKINSALDAIIAILQQAQTPAVPAVPADGTTGTNTTTGSSIIGSTGTDKSNTTSTSGTNTTNTSGTTNTTTNTTTDTTNTNSTSTNTTTGTTTN